MWSSERHSWFIYVWIKNKQSQRWYSLIYSHPIYKRNVSRRNAIQFWEINASHSQTILKYILLECEKLTCHPVHSKRQDIDTSLEPDYNVYDIPFANTSFVFLLILIDCTITAKSIHPCCESRLDTGTQSDLLTATQFTHSQGSHQCFLIIETHLVPDKFLHYQKLHLDRIHVVPLCESIKKDWTVVAALNDHTFWKNERVWAHFLPAYASFVSFPLLPAPSPSSVIGSTCSYS